MLNGIDIGIIAGYLGSVVVLGMALTWRTRRNKVRLVDVVGCTCLVALLIRATVTS